MTQIVTGNFPSAISQIVERLDSIGRRYRIQQLLRGLMRWAVVAAAVSLAAMAVAHFVGAGRWSEVTLVIWALAILTATWRWLLRPILIQPNPAVVARLVESRIAGLHNGLTNALLLSGRDDLVANPFLPEVYNEILQSADRQSLQAAIRMAELRPAFLRTMLLLLGMAIVATIFRGPLTHGWRQLLSPSAFVPAVGVARLVSVQPGNLQTVFGKPLELTVIAEAPRSIGQPPMKIHFEAIPGDAATVLPLPATAEALPSSIENLSDGAGASFRYVYRLDRLERSLRYRVEVGGTQSPWFAVNVIRDVKLQQLSLTMTPPAYLQETPRTLTLPAADLGKTPVAAPQGSTVEVSAIPDVPIDGAVLQLSDATALAEAHAQSNGGDSRRVTPLAPLRMTPSDSGRRFTASFPLLHDTPIVILLVDAAGQAMFSVPKERFVIAVTKDTPPIIGMKTPRQDLSVAPNEPIQIQALLRDDHGLSRGIIRIGIDLPTETPTTQPAANEAEMQTIVDQVFPAGTTEQELLKLIDLPPAARVHGTVVRVQVEAIDNRDLGMNAIAATSKNRSSGDTDAHSGRQTTRSAVCRVRLQDQTHAQHTSKNQAEALRKLLVEMLQTQKSLHADTRKLQTKAGFAAAGVKAIADGQAALCGKMQQTASTFDFPADDRIAQKTLLMLAIEPARNAVELATLLQSEPAAAARQKLSGELQSQQRRIIVSLESLLALLRQSHDATTQPTTRGAGDLASQADAFRKLNESLKAFISEQQRILNQTASLAKKPVDSFTDTEKKLADELAMAQEKLDAFMQQEIQNVSRLVEQDMANASLLMEMVELYAEVTMAKDALLIKAMEIAVPAEQMGVELATEIRTNTEKWLAESPDRTRWKQEDPPTKSDLPMAELPAELEDMIGELLEQEEDLFDAIEDVDANWHSSTDTGAGWEALDGPISNMTAKGVTGNQLPNNNEMPGRSGEGRSGRSQGEFVESTATGKGGRRTPTRLSPTDFQQGQVTEGSTDPTGGATGGGKISGQGGQGLEGMVPPQQTTQMQRLAQQQAQLRNTAERLNLQYQLGRYDNFKLLESIALMRRVESDLKANRYQTALRRKDLLLDRMDASRLLLGAEVHVTQDTTPTGQNKERKEIGDAMKGELPPAWKDALKAYYEKLASE